MKKLSKTEAEKEIKDFFEKIKEKTPKEIRKIKRLAMRHNIKLGEKRKLFCKKCYSTRLNILRIKNMIKLIQCKECGNISRWKMK
jgi:RNase P subunit RPR2